MTEKNLLRINASTKTPGNSVVSMPYSYRDAKDALKAIVSAKKDAVEDKAEKRKVGGPINGEDGKFSGSYFVKDLTDAEKATIEAAAEKDFALGKEGRAAREEVLKAERNAAKPAKADKPAKTPEEVEADKAARAAANAERAQKRDASRVLVDAGSVDVGGTVEKDGATVEVNHIGDTFNKDGKDVAYAYFGDLGAEMAEKAAAAAQKDASDEPAM